MIYVILSALANRCESQHLFTEEQIFQAKRRIVKACQISHPTITGTFTSHDLKRFIQDG